MTVVSYLVYAWPVTAVVTLCTGLAAFGFNVLNVLQLDSLRKPLQMFSGVCGLVSLYGWFVERNFVTVAFSGNAQLASATWFLTGLVALSIGLAAIGFDLVKTARLTKYRALLQYAAAAVGVYSLVAYFGMA
ncbi:MAG: hypothetical protein ACJAZS_000709 [Alteromonas naphthalenivorans]|jgi:hypothetical protein